MIAEPRGPPYQLRATRQIFLLDRAIVLFE
jgi:hypothetical protein